MEAVIIILVFVIIVLIINNFRKSKKSIKNNNLNVDENFHIEEEEIEEEYKPRRTQISEVRKHVDRPTKNNSFNVGNSVTVIDVETAKGNRNSICQIGIVVIENGTIKETFSSLIQPPENDYSFRNIQIHGIDSSTTKDSPLFPEVWEEIKHLFDDTKLVAHNVAFDSDCLFQTLEHYNLDVPSYVEDCTYTRTNLKLADLVLTLDVKLENHHDALADALACARCYMKLELGIEPNLSLIDKKLKADHILHDNAIEILAHESDHHFDGKKFLFTGVMQVLERKEAKEIVKELGGKIGSTITKGIDYVVMGNAPGPKKLRDIDDLKSKGFGIKVISEKTFLEIIK